MTQQTPTIPWQCNDPLWTQTIATTRASKMYDLSADKTRRPSPDDDTLQRYHSNLPLASYNTQEPSSPLRTCAPRWKTRRKHKQQQKNSGIIVARRMAALPQGLAPYLFVQTSTIVADAVVVVVVFYRFRYSFCVFLPTQYHPFLSLLKQNNKKMALYKHIHTYWQRT